MPTFSPEQLAAATGGRWTRMPERPVTGFTQDTRRLAPGQAFVALKTGQRDGHDFLAAAREGGAAAAIVGREVAGEPLPQLVTPDPLAAFQAIAREHRRRFGGKVIGVTGSAGKTSTKDLLALLLGGPETVLSTEGNLNNHIGVPLTLVRIEPERHRYAVVEAGIGAPGEMAPLAAMIEPDLAIVTLVAPAHLEGLGTVEGVAREKAVLAAAVRPKGVALFPQSCEAFEAFAGLAVKRMVAEPAHAVRPAEPESDRIHFATSQRGGRTAISMAYGRPRPMRFTLPCVSAGMAQNAVLAIAAALGLGVPSAAIHQRLALWRPAKWRGERRQVGAATVYCDFYNANPASMADALDAFDRGAPEAGPRLYVLGGMEELGPLAPDYHRRLGLSLRLRPGDFVFVMGDHASAVREGALAAGAASEQIAAIDDLQPVRERLAGFAGSVFLKGSRRHRLEAVLEDAAAPVSVHA